MNRSIDYIIRRECDEPMARSKGLLPCEKDCKNCMACIEVTETGERQHCVRHNDSMEKRFLKAITEAENKVMREAVKWSKEDEELLIKLHAGGWSRRDIANRLNRTARSVSIKLSRLKAKQNEGK